MPVSNFITAAFRIKRRSHLALVLLISGLPVSASFGQTIPGKVNSYLQEQVKETAITGAILVADNMTDWLNVSVATPAVAKPIPKALPKYTPVRCKGATRPKSAVVFKSPRRSS